jgi:signal transduction histidine kinase
MRELWQTIQNGQVWRGEIRNRAKDGSLYWVDTTIVPFLDPQGKPYQYLAIHSDVTDRKRAEEEHRRREALATVGQMAAVVAHEVKNPLAGIAGAIEIVGGRLPSDSPDREVIAGILRRIDTLNRRVQDLLLFARPRAPRVGPVGLKPLLRETAGLLATDCGLSGTDVEISGQELVVPGDAELLRDVFLNLLLNAAQAMGGRGRIQVVTSGSNSGCTVVVRDTGPGIPPEHQERIFEPFFSSKSGGTGLGLPIAKRIVEAHGGTIGIESRPGEGTAVTVTLPLGPRAPGAAGTARQGEGA